MTKRLSALLFLSVLFAAAPAPAREVPALGEAVLQAIPPGRDLSPAFSDPGRVRLILDLTARINDGRPLPFPKDGTVWQNKEGRLPPRPLGFYREYTILPPAGSPSTVTVGDRTYAIDPPRGTRGVERLIVGGGEFLYYTPDHYRSFIPLSVVR